MSPSGEICLRRRELLQQQFLNPPFQFKNTQPWLKRWLQKGVSCLLLHEQMQLCPVSMNVGLTYFCEMYSFAKMAKGTISDAASELEDGNNGTWMQCTDKRFAYLCPYGWKKEKLIIAKVVV